ncbi:hypothetical protein WN944_007873 [Citrus x changshan-huyou]|uniref:Uncharacterized protein n=2 Tax=Citrus TaxID=2706 RepID=A0AAP0QYE7_9ROSI
MGNDEEASSSNRPSIGFPLGLALLLMMLFCMSGVLTCCLNWHKVRSLLIHADNDNIQTNIHHLHTFQAPEQNQIQSLLVSMPGDQVPKFVAMACPCKPPTLAMHGEGRHSDVCAQPS